MKHRMTIILITMITIVGLVACQAPVDTTPEPTAAPEINEADLTPDQILTLGDVSNEPVEKIEELTPMAEYLAAQLADQGIVKAEVVVAPEIDVMVEYLKDGTVDLYFDSPYAALTVYEEAGAIPLARRWRKGIGEYHTNIVVMQESGLTTIDDLLGQVIGFERPDSSTGSRMPQAHLLNLGYDMVEVESTDETVAADAIGYIYTGSDDDIIASLLDGRTAAGVIPSDDWAGLDDEIKDQFLIVTETPDVPRHVALAQPNLDPALQAQIAAILMGMHENPENEALLSDFGSTNKFDEFPLGPEGTMENLQEIFAPVR